MVSFTLAANTGRKGKGQRECVMIDGDETVISAGGWTIIEGKRRRRKRGRMLFLDIQQKRNAI